ncbi:MAG: Asp-tRNA(Asn)/Glu-tRNA(Gln) amidotransferase subunit GatC [Candidatus Omnitrophica bacterium]|nr:Asp-tRNA(Asn)/Glu-tRNA(Gln) amidotransferase subunit GatC [Candidatus Omnitrophota bacterium]MDD5081393.1 Asp-tRNA(Asn)/Glu-tRNA(Gln) amidotransferase subunit GatC [Candidatus Omnitrophota bacterium]MDD5440760.1 Asp-tRNA(Asn)/Glu-tRNA(Gln) amidotransferase subunit GatC [Candidatus Omnitrophota bacterium]
MIDKKQVEYVANLAKIAISEEQAQKLGHQMADIVGYIDKLSEVDVDQIEPLRAVNESFNVWREDVTKRIFDLERIKANMPESDGDSFKVPNVI